VLAGRATADKPPTTAAIRRRIEQAALLYFHENTHPRTGLVRVAASNFTGKPDGPENRRASIAATGYGLAVMTNIWRRYGLADAGNFDDPEAE
jgi:hypothetical protein